jgi:hypothetical protein
MDAAVRLYGQGKWALAQKEFEKSIKVGTADVATHGYLAWCLYQQRKYVAAQKEYEWVAKYSTKNIKLQRSAKAAAHMIASRRAGICPGTCLKARDSRWQRRPDGLKWMRFSYSRGYMEWSQNHLGEIIVFEKGKPVNKGKCNLCEGAGTVPVLKDGMPPPC